MEGTMETQAHYFHTFDCESEGKQHEWRLTESQGEFDSYGKGTMRYRSCHQCSTTEYIRFTDEKGNVNDIEAMLQKHGLRSGR